MVVLDMTYSGFGNSSATLHRASRRCLLTLRFLLLDWLFCLLSWMGCLLLVSKPWSALDRLVLKRFYLSGLHRHHLSCAPMLTLQMWNCVTAGWTWAILSTSCYFHSSLIGDWVIAFFVNPCDRPLSITTSSTLLWKFVRYAPSHRHGCGYIITQDSEPNINIIWPKFEYVVQKTRPRPLTKSCSGLPLWIWASSMF